MMDPQYDYDEYDYHDGGSPLLPFSTTRWLQDQGSNSTGMTNNTTSNSAAAPERTNTELLLSALRVYGMVLVVLFPVYCFVRIRCPRIYAVKQWVNAIKSPLAVSQFGYISWIWKVYGITSSADAELVEHIGLDALCLLRVLYLGLRLAAVGCFNSIWLFPVYVTADKAETDPLNQIAINVLQQGSPRFLATVLGNYVFFGYFFYALLHEFQWFIRMRHAWLSRLEARNYTVFVRNIPQGMRSAVALKQHFELLYGPGSVLQANMVLHIADFCAAVEKRKRIVAKLEHALAVLAIHNTRSKHLAPKIEKSDLGTEGTSADDKDNSNGGDVTHGSKKRLQLKVDSIEYFTEQLEKANEDVARRLNEIQRKNRPTLYKDSLYSKKYSDTNSLMAQRQRGASLDMPEVANQDTSLRTSHGVDDDDEGNANHPLMGGGSANSVSFQDDGTATIFGQSKRKLNKNTSDFLRMRASDALEFLDKAEGIADTVFKTVAEEGKPDDAAFVTFKSLVAAHAAMQMSQHDVPYVLETVVTPDTPEFIFWGNVGADREMVQTGQLISSGLTVAICLFWTIPVTAIVNLTNAQELTKLYPGVEPLFDNNPWLATALSTLAPILLLLLNTGLLPIVLKAVSRVEFPASDSQLEASAFWKMCSFHIIQTFFVSMVSSSVVQEIQNIVNNPTEAVMFLGKAIPEQSAFFMQLLMVSTTMGVLIELFRIIPLFQAFVRSLLGWKLTEKERSQSIGMFKPLCVVDKFYYSRAQSKFSLYFLIMFTYNSTSPLINWFSLVFFLILGSVYRHQFIFNYPKGPDTGGEIWLFFIQVILGCMIIAEVVLAGMLGLKEAPTSLAVLVPLIVISVIFIMYLQKQHFKIGQYLPARAALRKDLENDEQSVDFSVFNDRYKNPALLQRRLDPDWDSGKSEALQRQGIHPLTPLDDPESPAITATDETNKARKTSVQTASPTANFESLGAIVDVATSSQGTEIEVSPTKLTTNLSGDLEDDSQNGDDGNASKSMDEQDEEAKGEALIADLKSLFGGTY